MLVDNIMKHVEEETNDAEKLAQTLWRTASMPGMASYSRHATTPSSKHHKTPGWGENDLP